MSGIPFRGAQCFLFAICLVVACGGDDEPTPDGTVDDTGGAGDTGNDTTDDAGGDAGDDAANDGGGGGDTGGDVSGDGGGGGDSDTGGAVTTIDVSGLVTDESGEPVEGAILAFEDGTATTTDADGFASAEVDATGDELTVTVAALDLGTIRRTIPIDDGEAILSAILLEVTIVSLDSAVATVTTDEGMSLELNGEFTIDGAATTGSVDLALVPLIDAARLRALPAPEAGTDTLLGADVSFAQGDVDVDFDGIARVRWVLPPGLAAADLDGALLRYYDDETGEWVEGGDLFVADGIVTAAVDHFSQWAVHRPGDAGCVDVELSVDGADSTAPIFLTAVPTGRPGVATVTAPPGDDGACLALQRGATYSILAESWTQSGGSKTVVAASASGVTPGESECGRGCTPVELDLIEGDFDGDSHGPGIDGDCNDDDDSIYPGAEDLIDELGIDSNCDGIDGVDADGDGVVAESSGGEDCDDTDATVFPGRPDVGILGAGDIGVDNDCDEEIDEDGDRDGDGFISAAYGGDDCNDSLDTINPDATDTPDDGIDQDCDGADAGDGGGDPGRDVDGDGFIEGSSDSEDCNDRDSSVFPGAPELCNWNGTGRGEGTDNNCDGVVDPDDPALADQIKERYKDIDGDGYGGGSATRVCDGLPGWVDNDDDCADLFAAINPDGAETCNGQDDNCDEEIDEGGICIDGGIWDGLYEGEVIVRVVATGGTATLASCRQDISFAVRDGGSPEILLLPSGGFVLGGDVRCEFNLGGSTYNLGVSLSGGVGEDGNAVGTGVVAWLSNAYPGDWQGTFDDDGNFDGFAVDPPTVDLAILGEGDAVVTFTSSRTGDAPVFDKDFDGDPDTDDCADLETDPDTRIPGSRLSSRLYETCDQYDDTTLDEDCDGQVDAADDDLGVGGCDRFEDPQPVADGTQTGTIYFEWAKEVEDGDPVMYSTTCDLTMPVETQNIRAFTEEGGGDEGHVNPLTEECTVDVDGTDHQVILNSLDGDVGSPGADGRLSITMPDGFPIEEDNLEWFGLVDAEDGSIEGAGVVVSYRAPRERLFVSFETSPPTE